LLREFEYYRPTSIEEAMEIKRDHSNHPAHYIAGGTDVLVNLRQNPDASPSVLISLKNIPDATGIRLENGSLRISTFTTIRQLEKSDVVKERFTALHDAASQLGSVQVRNVATLGGNLCSSLPSADTAAPLLVMEAEAVIATRSSSKKVPLAEFFTGPGKNVLEDEELLLAVEIPEPSDDVYTSYVKHGRRRAMEIALAGAAVKLKLDQKKSTCEDIKLALSTSAPTPLISLRAQEYLIGKELTPANIEQAGLEALKDASPRDSYRTTAEYRRLVIPVLVKKAIMKAMQRGGVKNE